VDWTFAQACGPVALVSLLLNDGLTKAVPGSDINDNPNQPIDPALQMAFNHAAIQVLSLLPVANRLTNMVPAQCSSI
jgi:hypothetical protein